MSSVEPMEDSRPLTQYNIVCPFCGEGIKVDTRHELDVNILPDTVSLVVRAIGATTHNCTEVKR